MQTQLGAALKRLDAILPLQSGLQSLSESDAALYCKLLNSYVARGWTLDRDEVAALVSDADQALKRVVDSKLIVLDADGNPAGAYPFTSEEREHRIHIDGVVAHCMCALDALAVSPMFNTATAIDSRCRATGNKIHIEQNGNRLTAGTLDARFGIDWGAACGDAVCAESLCMEMVFLADESVASDWLAASPDMREIFDLPAAVEFAAGFFVPLARKCVQLA